MAEVARAAGRDGDAAGEVRHPRALIQDVLAGAQVGWSEMRGQEHKRLLEVDRENMGPLPVADTRMRRCYRKHVWILRQRSVADSRGAVEGRIQSRGGTRRLQ